MTARPLSTRPWSRRTEGVWAVGFWVVLGLLTVVRQAVRPWREDPIAAGEIVETLGEYGLWALITPLVFEVARRFPAERESWAGRLAGQVGLGVVLALAIEVLTRGVLRPLLVTPPPDGFSWSLTSTISQLWFLDELVIYFAVLAAGYARSALFQLRERQVEAERLLADRARLEAQLSEARLSALRMQLNPHFLFNTLNAVSALVERDPSGVRTMIARLSSLLRHVLETDGAHLVPLRDEVAFLRDYLDVQQVRFQGRLEVEEALDPDTLDALVPPLLFQPLVENAVGHGVSRIEEGVGTIRLTARHTGDRLVLAVEDNGPGLDDGGPPKQTGVGLANTRARLDAIYGSSGTLTLRPVESGGVVAEVALPFETEPEVGSDGAATPAPEVAHP